MKLPTLKSAPVQRLETPSPQVAAAPGRALGDIGRVIGGQVDEYLEKRHRDEVLQESITSESTARERNLDLLQSTSDMYIPEGDKRLTDIDYDEGSVITGPDGGRYVPTSEVGVQIIEKGSEAIYREIASTLKTEEAQQAFTEFYSNLSDKSRQIAFLQSEKNRKAAAAASYLETYNEQVIRGDFEGAEKTVAAARISGTISEETAVKQQYSLQVAKEEIRLNELVDSGDTEAMYSAAEALRDDENYKGALSYTRRHELADKIEETAYKQEQDQITAESKAETNRYDTLLLRPPESEADVREREAAAAWLRSEEYDGAITDPTKRDGLADSLETQAATSNLSIAAKQEREEGRYVSDMELGVKDPNGTTTATQIEDSYNRGLIDDSKRTQLMDGVRKRDEDKQSRAAMANIIAYAGKNNIPLDPGNKDVKQGINGIYDQKVAEGQDPIVAGLDVMQQYRIMPEGIKGILRASNRADAGGLIDAAQVYNAGIVQAPQSMADISADSVSTVANVAANLRLGMSPEDAAATVQAWQAMPETRQAAVKEQISFSQEANAARFKEQINDANEYDVPWTPFEEEPTVTMGIEYDRLVEKYIPVTGDIQAAQEMAFDVIRNKWQLTDVNGEYQYMKYAPQGDVELIQRDIEGAYGPNTLIQSDPATELQRLNGEKPSYRVYKKQHEPDPLPDEGWQDEFEKQTGLEPEALNITDKSDADSYMATQFSVGFYELPRYTFDSEKAVQAESDRLKAEAQKAIDERQEFSRSREQFKQRLVEGRARRMAIMEMPGRELTTTKEEKEAYIQSEKGKREYDRALTNLVAAGDIPQYRADIARKNMEPSL